MQDAAPIVRHLAWYAISAFFALGRAALAEPGGSPDSVEVTVDSDEDAGRDAPVNGPELDADPGTLDGSGPAADSLTDELQTPAPAQESDPPPEPPGDPVAVAGDSQTAGQPADGPEKGLPVDIEPQPIVFRGIQPGRSTPEEVRAAWGVPRATDAPEQPEAPDEPERYDLLPLGQAEVRYRGGHVESIVLVLAEPVGIEQIASQFELDGFRTVRLWTPTGEPLGVAYPERGVVLGFGPSDRAAEVAQVVLETIDSEAFLLRAESNLFGPCRASLDDLSFVIHENPDNARAHSLRARLELRLGRPKAAEESARRAVELNPESSEYRLTWAQCLAAGGLEQRAVEECSTARQKAADDELVRAGALLLLASMPEQGQRHLGKLPIDLCIESIRLADSLSADPRVSVRREARRRLVDAHLAVAREIAWGHWQQKSRVVPQWLARAKRLAEGCEDETDRGDLWLQVAEESLHALAGLQPAADPAGWIDAAEQAAEDLIKRWNDPLWKDLIDWRMGIVYFWAMQVEHHRGRMEEGLRYGELARDHLERGATSREATAEDEYLASRLYFQIGALHAVHAEDHARAIEWYERALESMPELSRTRRYRGMTSSGDALVSMGVSYWKIGAEERAIELTRRGASLIDRDVHEGFGDATALAVPYGNLAAMHAVRGETDEVQRYENLMRHPVTGPPFASRAGSVPATSERGEAQGLR
jgi:tetratricopeptide (TPR) repeat protein